MKYIVILGVVAIVGVAFARSTAHMEMQMSSPSPSDLSSDNPQNAGKNNMQASIDDVTGNADKPCGRGGPPPRGGGDNPDIDDAEPVKQRQGKKQGGKNGKQTGGGGKKGGKKE